jgi:NADH dehydrogenase [ubiquinone] 1 alpha subcomplex assembly factor 7
MPFDEFMEVALYAHGGYYDEPPIGSDRDFVTSPHVHWWFAYAISVALGALQEPLRTAGTKRLVELGAGDGTLARQLLEILAGAGPIDYVAVERSVGARAALIELGIDVRASVEELGPLEGCLVFANELLDNLPFRRIRRRSDGTLAEVCVGLRGDRLAEFETDADATLAAFAPALDCGVETVVPTGALSLVDALADQMRDSYALFIDYSTERGGEVHGYRRQHVVEDVLQRPGSSDVTAAVDFDAVEGRARTSGLAVLGRVTQRAALLSLGFAAWAEAERGRARAVAAADATRAWAARSRASLLVEPSGLGAHRWTLLATPGLPAPGWLEAALRG